MTATADGICHPRCSHLTPASPLGASCWLGASPLLDTLLRPRGSHCRGRWRSLGMGFRAGWDQRPSVASSLYPVSAVARCSSSRTAAWCNTSTMDAASICNLFVARQESKKGLVLAVVGIFALLPGLRSKTCLEDGKMTCWQFCIFCLLTDHL